MFLAEKNRRKESDTAEEYCPRDEETRAKTEDSTSKTLDHAHNNSLMILNPIVLIKDWYKSVIIECIRTI